MNTRWISHVFHEKYVHPLFSTVMSTNRFVFLCSNLSFDDASTRTEKWQHDKFAAMMDVFEKFDSNCSKILVPDVFLSIYETLYPTRVSVSFRQYMKSKPAKYGLLFRSVSSAVIPYTYSTIVYAGKPHQEGPYHLTHTDYYVIALVDKLDPVSMDNFYT